PLISVGMILYSLFYYLIRSGALAGGSFEIPQGFRASIDLFVNAFLMGSGVIYYEHEKREQFEDYVEKADAKLGTIKIRRYDGDPKTGSEKAGRSVNSLGTNPALPIRCLLGPAAKVIPHFNPWPRHK
ncbi:hypothetical protein PIB30_096641, partial [Stylosanthes scabra]|nr:hypothetical protein [Stylosanthes scabra]